MFLHTPLMRTKIVGFYLSSISISMWLFLLNDPFNISNHWESEDLYTFFKEMKFQNIFFKSSAILQRILSHLVFFFMLFFRLFIIFFLNQRFHKIQNLKLILIYFILQIQRIFTVSGFLTLKNSNGYARPSLKYKRQNKTSFHFLIIVLHYHQIPKQGSLALFTHPYALHLLLQYLEPNPHVLHLITLSPIQLR